MTDNDYTPAPPDGAKVEMAEVKHRGRELPPRLAAVAAAVAFAWAGFQLWIASPLPFVVDFGIFNSAEARPLHLTFALLLCFLIFPGRRGSLHAPVTFWDLALAAAGVVTAGYLFVSYEDLSARAGDFFPFEFVLGGIGIVVLLEAARRSLGWPLVVIAALFLAFSIFGRQMPEILQHKGVSLMSLVGYQWLGEEGIFGIPLGVSTDFVFLFVLFGALMERAGAGKYFLDLSFALVGRFRGGPAKASILASGFTGLVSGSSIANVVTTGTFTIPLMRATGLPAVKAGAIEVAASVNGQIMPPVMGAAAFVMAGFLGIPYIEVVKAAFIPAVIAYLALLFISHLEALKLGLKGLPREELPPLKKTFLAGVHYLLPVAVLLYLLVVARWTAGTSVFYACLAMMALMVLQSLVSAWRGGRTAAAALLRSLSDIAAGMIMGARNMVCIAVAVAAAGIIVGTVSLTGLGSSMLQLVETAAGGSVYLLLALTALICLVLGMGLPTTANYLVVASLMAPVLVELGNAAGLVLPLIAVHLYVFYFGLMADVTPPVGLAAYAAAAISRADPVRTGIQAFAYELRTAILPVVFIFNTELLLIGVSSVWHAIGVFAASLTAILCFSALTKGWLIVKLRFVEAVVLAAVAFALFRPDAVLDLADPEFAPLDLKSVAAGDVPVEPGRKVRLRVIRETRYGERHKLFVFAVPQPEAGAAAGPLGIAFEAAPQGEDLGGRGEARYLVTDMAFGGAAERAGLDFGDVVTAAGVENPRRISKGWVYLLAVVLLAAVVARQLARRRA